MRSTPRQARGCLGAATAGDARRFFARPNQGGPQRPVGLEALQAQTLLAYSVNFEHGTRQQQSDQKGTTPDRKPRRRAVLRPIDLQVLVAFADDPTQSTSQIARRLTLEPSTVTHAFRDLWEHGLVHIDNQDTGKRKRAKRTLTDPGQERVSELIAEARRALREHAER